MSPSTTADNAHPPGSITLWLAAFGVPAAFIWGVAEAIAFFIIPDVMVGGVALFVPRNWLRVAAAALVGSLIGGMILYGVASAATERTQDLVAAIPGIPGQMTDRVQELVTDHGAAALVRAPFAGIPYKVYVTEMAAQSVSPLSVLLWSVPARAWRILLVALGYGAAGYVLRRRVGMWPGRFLALYLAGWVGVYVAYFSANGF